MLRANELAADNARCLAFGHIWPRSPNPTPPGERPAPRGYIAIFMVCEECGMEKRILVHRSSGETRNRYRKPKGYSLDGWSRREWKASWAIEWDQRVTERQRKRKSRRR